MASEPKPPRTKYGTLRTLRAATVTYCEGWLSWRHGDDAATWGQWCEDYSRGRAAEEKAHLFEAEAAKIRKLFERAEKLANAFEKRCPLGTAGLASDFVVRAAHAVRDARPGASVISDAGRLGFGEEPTRATWVRDLPPWVTAQSPDNWALAVYSILSGFWPDRVNKESVATAAERRGGASVAEVMRAERNAIGEGRKPRKIAEANEAWLLSELKKRPQR